MSTVMSSSRRRLLKLAAPSGFSTTPHHYNSRPHPSQMKIREIRDRRRRELDAPARLDFKRRQLKVEREENRSPERVARLEREVADLEVEVLASLSR